MAQCLIFTGSSVGGRGLRYLKTEIIYEASLTIWLIRQQAVYNTEQAFLYSEMEHGYFRTYRLFNLSCDFFESANNFLDYIK